MALFMKRNGQLVPVRCLNGSLTIKPSQPAPTVDYLCFTAQQANSTVYLKKVGTPYENTIQYSYDGSTWQNEDFSTPKTLANVGDKIYYKGNGDLSKNDDNLYRFVMTGIIGASGSIMSLLDGVGTSNTITQPSTFRRLFYGCSSLTTAPSLPATTLAGYCYYNMFYGCTSLTTAPSLPATTLASVCYSYMFCGCTSLTTAPSLPATTLSNFCYQYMFSGCSSLTTAPSLPATTLAIFCYQYMFKGCISLTTVPELPAVTLYTSCYAYMFNGCTSLAVSDTSGTRYTNAWRIPTSGTFTNTYSQSGMFTRCAGTRSSNNMAGAQGQSYTYYTQNAPV